MSRARRFGPGATLCARRARPRPTSAVRKRWMPS
jgi:CPSaseIIsmall: carbamoyl-phosphate synthase, small subunit